MTAWEDAEENGEGWGTPMWWSHFGEDDNLRLIREARFAVEVAETC